MIKKLMLGSVVAVLLMLVTMVVRTFLFESQQSHYPQVDALDVDDAVVQRLSEVIRIKTISYDDSTYIDYSQFDSLHLFLKQKYPLVDSLLEKKHINTYSLLYRWQGTNPDLRPAIFTGHQDVVPVEKETLGKWTYPPFSGKIADGFVWGRGTLDDKGAILAIMEAVTALLKEGFQPERTILFGFGHDEEVDGIHGAKRIVHHLHNHKVEAEFVMDEGLIITKGLVPGIKDRKIALIGTSEKGYLTAELSVEIKGGHSSMPEYETAVDVLAKAIYQLKSNPFAYELNETVNTFSDIVGPEMPFGLKMVFANKWLLENQILDAYAESAAGRAMISTTIAPTLFNAGLKENSIPSVAQATVNFRILPGITIDELLAKVEAIIDDKRVKITKRGSPYAASPIASHKRFGYKAIEKALRESDSTMLVAPNLMVATADARYYPKISDDVYRFLPVTFEANDLPRIHGINERIGIENYKQSIRFYYRIFKNAAKSKL